MLAIMRKGYEAVRSIVNSINQSFKGYTKEGRLCNATIREEFNVQSLVGVAVGQKEK